MSDYLGLDSTLINHRNKHDAVGIEEVKMGSRKTAARVVVKTHRRFIEMLEKEGVADAYYEVARAYNTIAGSLGVKAFDPAKIRAPSGSGDFDTDGDALARYKSWYERCKSRYLAPKFVLQSIEGESLRQIDKKAKMQTGTAREQIVKCLKEWN